jgi:hypothetical protein
MEKEYKQARMEPSCTTVNGRWGNSSALDPNPTNRSWTTVSVGDPAFLCFPLAVA